MADYFFLQIYVVYFFFGAWYHKSGNWHTQIKYVETELNILIVGRIGSFVIGNVSIWHEKWVKYLFTYNFKVERMHNICKMHGLKQFKYESY